MNMNNFPKAQLTGIGANFCAALKLNPRPQNIAITSMRLSSRYGLFRSFSRKHCSLLPNRIRKSLLKALFIQRPRMSTIM